MFEGFEPRLNSKGYTGIPNSFFDEVLAKVDSLAELKLMLAIFRKTYGWISHIDEDGQIVYKEQDAISYSQFNELTGLSAPSISSGIIKGIEDGYIERVAVGNISGKTSVYKIKQKGSKPKINIEPDTVKIEEKIETPVTKEDVVEPSFKPPVTDEESTIKDIFGERPPEKEKKQRVKGKNCNDLLRVFGEMYWKTLKMPYGQVNNKDRGQAKELIETYGYDACLVAMAHYLLHHSQYTSGYPSFQVLYGWRKTIFPDALRGPAKKENAQTKAREYTGGMEEGGDINSWD